LNRNHLGMTRTAETPSSWLTGQPLFGFGLPRGRLARLLGWVMSRSNLAEQRDILDFLAVRPGERVLEVGHGPGTLLKLLADAGVTVSGVDPSPEMVAMTRRRLRAAIRDGRAETRVGTAEATGHPDQAYDAVVSVNNVPMWSDLGAGLSELYRVLRPGGRLVVSWHGGRTPLPAARRLTLPDEPLQRILTSTRQVFGDAERQELEHVVVFHAIRQP
jgi:SAM-dependent methyltransferase